MRISAYRFQWVVVLLVASAAGCSRPAADRSPPTGETLPEAEVAIRKQFAEVQAAIKARDADKLWALLSTKSQIDAEKAANGVRTTYELAGPQERAKQERDLGMKGEDLAKLTGMGFLKTKTFLRKGDEVAESTVTRVTAAADSATLYFTEPDGDKEKLVFVREEGGWKAWMTMPKPKKP